MTVANYFLVGWLDDRLDHFYLPSWKVFVSLVVVFNITGGVSLAVVRYRTEHRSLIGSLWENFKWTPMMAIFFGGLSFHVSVALLSHLLHIDMQWGATSKEKENSNFFQEVPKIIKSFKYMLVLTLLFSRTCGHDTGTGISERATLIRFLTVGIYSSFCLQDPWCISHAGLLGAGRLPILLPSSLWLWFWAPMP